MWGLVAILLSQADAGVEGPATIEPVAELM